MEKILITVKFGSAIYMYCSHDYEVDLLLLA